MNSNRKAKPSPADKAAAVRLEAAWIDRARARGYSQEKAAGELGISQGAVSQYLKGKIPLNYKALLGFSRILGIDPNSIRNDLQEQSMTPSSSIDQPYADVTAFAQAVGLGAGAEAQEYADTNSLKFKASSLRKRGILGGKLSIYYGKGDSMEPTIKDGDAILFDEADIRILDGRLYVVQTGKEIYVKRAEVLDDAVYFRSDNPSGDHNWKKARRMDNKKAPIYVIGRVHWIGAWAD